MEPKHNDSVLLFLKKNRIDGATISELVRATGLTRDNVRIALAALEGGGLVHSRVVGKAKLYRVKDGK